ncbi:MAG: hypothetical protein ACI97N_001968 [Cognaticolwellia sp.]|jgi:hypothetical protein
MKNTFTKIIVVLGVIFVLNFISGCISDICPSPVFFYLKDVGIHALDRVEESDGTYSSIYTDTIRHQVAFEVRSVVELASINPENRLKWGLMNTAYGCGNGIALNPPVITKSSMSVNHPIYWSGTRLLPNTNILEHPEFKEYVNFPETLSYEGYSIITIDSIPLKFLSEPYIFTFEWETSDGIILKDEVEVVIRI